MSEKGIGNHLRTIAQGMRILKLSYERPPLILQRARSCRLRPTARWVMLGAGECPMTASDRERALDEALEETFPASDPPANTVETGIRVDVESPGASELVVRDHREASRFEAVIDGHIAFLQYVRRPNAFVFLHTEVPESLRGRGIASQLAKVGLQSARAEGLPIVVQCPFVRAYLRKHPAAGDPRSTP
jgi:predicted GNAT family acetyltransferase